MATSYNERDLDLVPPLTFSYVENYIKSKKKSSGEKTASKGFKYFCEGYIQDLKVTPNDEGCQVSGKCYRSQRKNESPHNLKVSFRSRNAADACISAANCTCPVGLTGLCGHVVGMLYQPAKYKTLGQKALPQDLAKTSQPQTWHAPRGPKIYGKTVQDLEVSGFSKQSRLEETPPQTIKTTLYNPIRGEGVNWESKLPLLKHADGQMLILPALESHHASKVVCKFGLVPKGSVLSYQQKFTSECIINLFNETCFPNLPHSNFMQNLLNMTLTAQQHVTMESLKVTISEATRFEEQTRLQSQSTLWYKIRKHRMTASTVGDIYKRRKYHATLVDRLKSTRHVTTAAMRQGLASEPMAASSYADAKQNRVNRYPCGVVVNVWSPWLAATPDRKVYNPAMSPPYGLLEIKCPQVNTILEANYLLKDQDGVLKLKRNHNYYYQVLCQLAVTGLEWCDFFVWCNNDYHLETIYFNKDVWQEVKNKIDMFYFSYFI